MLFYPILHHFVAQRAEHRVKTFFCLLHDRQGDLFVVAVRHIVVRLQGFQPNIFFGDHSGFKRRLITRFGEPSANSV